MVKVCDFFLVVCDIAANHQEQMPMEESGNMVGGDIYMYMYVLQYIGIDNVYCMCTALLSVYVSYKVYTSYLWICCANPGSTLYVHTSSAADHAGLPSHARR